MFNQFVDWLDSMLALQRRSTWELADWLNDAIDRLCSNPVYLKQEPTSHECADRESQDYEDLSQ